MTKEEFRDYVEFLRSQNEISYDVYSGLIDGIDTLEQEPCEETGHWIKYGVPRCGEQHYKCTSCGYYINFGQWGEFYTKQFKYCPNCGRRMIDPQERSE